MRLRTLTTLLVASALAVAVAAAGCGGGDDDDTTTTGDGPRTVTVYSSLPLHGPARAEGNAIVRAIDLALEHAEGRAGDVTVEHRSLDDAPDGRWTPEVTSANARRVAQDESAVAYIGDFHTRATRIAMPILNEAQVAQVSPGKSAVGLTTDSAGAEEDEPDRYYPTGDRHFVRIVPTDTVQAAALATVMQQDGCTRIAVAHDGAPYGAGLASLFASALEKREVGLAFNEPVDLDIPAFGGLVARLTGQDVDCLLFSGIASEGAVQLVEEVARALPDLRLYGPDGLAVPEFSDPEKGGIPPSVARRIKISVATLSPESYPPAGQDFFEAFEETYGVANANPYAIYGYEAMRLVLDAIERAGSADRTEVIRALFDTSDRDSVLGRYSIDENGDTTLTAYGIYTIESGRLIFDQKVTPEL